MRERFFAFFEKGCPPRLVATFRIAFFTGLALHFGPALVLIEENFTVGSVRARQWNDWLFFHLGDVPLPALRILAAVTLLAIVSGLVGFRPRLSSCITFVGSWVFASFNALPVQTLALFNAWAVLTVCCVCGGASHVWSLDAWLHKGPAGPPPSTLGRLIFFQCALGFFFAGVEKVLWGYLSHNEMAMLLATPRGYILRSWVHEVPLLRATWVTWTMSLSTVLIELLAPLLLLVRRTRLWALAAYELLFLAIIAMIEVPPLFFCMFFFGGLLVVDREDVVSIRRLLARQPGAPAPPPPGTTTR